MDPDRFVTLGIVAIVAVIVGFIVRALSRAIVSTEVASVIAAPFILGGFALVVALTVVAALAHLGVGPLAEATRDND